MAQRLDQVLVERGLVDSRSQAQKFIRAGLVRSHGHILDKPGASVADDIHLEVVGKPHPYVSRGGVKLAHGLEVFAIDPARQRVLDLGASTGGFTDCLLQRGAERVYAVDVGRNQLAWVMRSHDRVVVLEETNARHLTREHVPETMDGLTADVSFISLTLVLEPALPLVRPGGWGIVLVKPQFEVGREFVGRNGVVRDPAHRQMAVDKVRDYLIGRDCTILGVDPSPILGPKGNEEFVMGFRLPGDSSPGVSPSIRAT